MRGVRPGGERTGARNLTALDTERNQTAGASWTRRAGIDGARGHSDARRKNERRLKRSYDCDTGRRDDTVHWRGRRLEREHLATLFVAAARRVRRPARFFVVARTVARRDCTLVIGGDGLDAVEDPAPDLGEARGENEHRCTCCEEPGESHHCPET